MKQALDRPVCTATIVDEHTVTVSIDEVETTLDSMDAAVVHLADTARQLRRPVKVTAIDPTAQDDPQARLVINGDGAVTPDHEPMNRRRPPRRSTSQTVTHPVSTTTAAGTQTLTEAPPQREDTSAQGTGGDPQPAAAPRPAPPAPDAVPATRQAPPPGPARPAPAVARPPATAAPAPDLEQVRLHLDDESPTTARAREGWRGWLNAALGTNLGPGAVEQAGRERRVRIQRPLETHRTAAVIELKGGGGKTTIAYHLAATYGRVRGGSVLVAEVNENQGTMGDRAQAAGHDRTILDVIRNLDTITRNTTELVRYLRPQGEDRIHVLASPPEGTDRSRVDGRAVRTTHQALRSLNQLILLDTGNSAQASTWQAAVDVADSLVFVTHNKKDGARLFEATVKAVTAEGHAEKLARSILVISNTAQGNQDRLTRLRNYAHNVGLAEIVVIPFDPSLEDGEDFNYDTLRPGTVRAYEEATAALTDQL